ncbi:MAG: rRNA maturation RNase YbeY [Firmicutes bacterium HGW-Firmicutes-16]|nr:MAG: rRNA maturation RNase YbeY [Firmicutes bacterium HGW-Firmicutes-16]
MKHKIYLSREKRGLGQTPAKYWISEAVNAALNAEGIAVPCEVSVLLTDDAGIRKLNREFRNVDAATDVLSFPSNEFDPGSFDPENADHSPETDRVILGDMALSLEHAVVQGEEFGHGTKREIQYLTVHSVLHLLGYDHVDEGVMKKQMRSREKEIIALIDGVKEQ